MNKPKIVTLCGSTKFKQQFEEANKDFTLKGFIVLSVGFFMHKESTSIILVNLFTVSLSSQWVSYTIENLTKLPPIIDIVKYIERYLKKINWLQSSLPSNM